MIKKHIFEWYNLSYKNNCYSYEEQWQPKDFPVIFRMYQLNFDNNDDFIYKKYWDMYENHFIEEV